jgi:magnesium chelatase family protein
MTVATVASRALAGIDAPEVTVEVHLGPGLPAFHIVGLPDTEVREARDRVRAALNHSRFEFPARRITVNLAPAELPKDSTRFDLPIALSILAASGQLAPESLAGQEFAGELSLTGDLRPVRGALAMALSARHAGRCFVLPEGNAPQAALASCPRARCSTWWRTSRATRRSPSTAAKSRAPRPPTPTSARCAGSSR